MGEVYLRKARWEDVDLLFEWANEEEVRENSFNSEKINYEEHKQWYRNCLEDVVVDSYICYLDSNPVGQIRLNYNNENAIISYSIDKKYRGQGFGGLIIQLVEAEIRQIHPETLFLIGSVKFDNIVSQRIFEKNDYIKRPINESREGFIYCKKIDT